MKCKKSQHHKCYLSKTIAYKEDPPHWCSVTELIKVIGGHQCAESMHGGMYGYLGCALKPIFGSELLTEVVVALLD